jgi:hypothetical protein
MLLVYPGTRLIESRQIPCLFGLVERLILQKLYESVVHSQMITAY